VKYVTNGKNTTMDVCTITEEPTSEAAAPTMESIRLRTALREMHALARKYLALTGGGLSDGTDAAAVWRAAALLGIEE
jgi:hypothetical protein